MLTVVEITTAQGATLVLPLGDPQGGYVVDDIDGLDPVKATMVSSSFAQLDGEQYQSSRRESRNIILKLSLEPDFDTGTVAALRTRLYTFLMPKSLVRMRFYADGEPTVDIYGRVETFDSPRFVKEPTATISLICHQPDFYSPIPVVVPGLTTSTMAETLIAYTGSVETGLVMTIKPARALPAFAIHHRPADDTIRKLEFEEPLLAGDTLVISTVPGSKSAILTRAGTSSSVLFGITPFSNWLELFPGPNNLRVYAEGAPVPYSIEYTTRFGGI